jgi:hypothetical protein
MRDWKATPALAGLAVCGALILGGCGGGDDSTTSAEPAGATTPAMKGDAMKDDDGSMKQGQGAMKDDDDAMHGDEADHGEAMKDG